MSRHAAQGRQARVSGLALWLAFLAGCKSLASAGALTEIIGPKWTAMTLAASSALDVATGAYITMLRLTPARRLPPTE